MKKCLVFVSSVVIMTTAAFAQPNPDTLWTRTYGGSASDRANCVRQTADGGYILAGRTFSFGSGLSDFWLVKTDENGDSLWSRTFGGDDIDECYSVRETSDGGYVLAGRTSSFGAGNRDFWLVKTDGNGDSLWSRTFGGPGYWEECYSVQQTPDGGYVLAGRTTSFGAGNCDFWLVKTDENGDSLWNRTFGGYLDEECWSVQQTSDGGYVLGGHTESFGPGTPYVNFWLVKTNASGDSLWSRTFGGSSHDECYSVRQTVDGGYILGGYTESFGVGNSDFWLVKTDENGDSLWSRTFGGDDIDECYSVEQTTDGGYILAGFTQSFGAGLRNFWLVKTNASGDSLWSRPFGSNYDDECRCAQQTSDGGYILGGYTGTYWNSFDFWLVKTGPELAAEPITISLPTQYTLHQNYPNPFNPVTTVRYDAKQTGRVRLMILNLLGQELTAIVDDMHSAGSYTVSWNAFDLPSGIYLCRMDAPGFTQIQKLVLIK